MIYDVYTLAAKDGAWIQVQLAIQPGYRFQWSGRKDRRSQEWPQRLHAAFRGQGWKWPARRITAMARPAEGPALGHEADLALAVGVLRGIRAMGRMARRKRTFGRPTRLAWSGPSRSHHRAEGGIRGGICLGMRAMGVKTQAFFG